jgi:hypothetical protein
VKTQFPIGPRPERDSKRISGAPKEGFLALLHSTDGRVIVLASAEEGEFQRALLLSEAVLT